MVASQTQFRDALGALVPQPQQAQQGIVQPKFIPGPIGGWNTRDAVVAMPPTDAVNLDNWFPTVGKVSVRGGYTEHATGVGISTSDVDMLASYRTRGFSFLIAAANGELWNATVVGPAVSLGSGFTSNFWQYSNYKELIYFANGADTVQVFDGTTLGASTFTGPTLTEVVGCHVFKNRIYFWENNDPNFWFSALDATSGPMTEFPLSVVGKMGGNLLFMATWTVDSGTGPDDFAVFVMTTGEIIVYQGSNPGNADDWSLVGIYEIPQPINIRSWLKVDGDLIILTIDDYYSLTEILKAGRHAPTKLTGAVQDIAANKNFTGWGAVYFKDMLIMNIPIDLADTSMVDQHVVNRSTGAACRYKDIPARSWVEHEDRLYFGGIDGRVFQAENGDDDDGASIEADGQSAWTPFDSPQRKRTTLVRPLIESVGQISYEFGLGFDFEFIVTDPAATSPVGGAIWDLAEWDVSFWAPDTVIGKRWRVARGSGDHVSIRLRVDALQEISWLRTDYRSEIGKNL